LISDDSGPSSATCKLAAWSSTGRRPGRPLLGSADQWDFSAVNQWEYRPDGRAERAHWSTAGRSTARQRRPVGPPARRPVGVPAGRAGPLVYGGGLHCSAAPTSGTSRPPTSGSTGRAGRAGGPTGRRRWAPLLGSADQWDLPPADQWEYRPGGAGGRAHWSTAGRSTARQCGTGGRLGRWGVPGGGGPADFMYTGGPGKTSWGSYEPPRTLKKNTQKKSTFMHRTRRPGSMHQAGFFSSFAFLCASTNPCDPLEVDPGHSGSKGLQGEPVGFYA